MNPKKSGKKTPNRTRSFKERFTRRWCVAASAVIALWSIWALLDAFVIPRDIVKAATEAEQSSEADSAQEQTGEAVSEEDLSSEERAGLLADPVITDHSYNNGVVSIEIRYMRRLSTDVYIADIILSDPAYLGTALAQGAFGRNLTDTTSSIASQNGAILAINGDYYGFRDSGFVMRGGYLYRTVPSDDPLQEDLILYEDGSVAILREADLSVEWVQQSGAMDIFSFGPGLVIDGEITVNKDDEVERAQVTNPRTGFGLISPLHYLFVVSDGRTEESIGLSLLELATLMKELGCVTAYNLDGGGSSTMWFNGKVLNQPTTFGDTITERNVSDIVYISK